MEILKVSAKSNPNSVAGALAGVLREHSSAEMQAIGAGALNQAVKAVAIARGFVAPHGIDLICIPSFTDINIEGEEYKGREITDYDKNELLKYWNLIKDKVDVKKLAQVCQWEKSINKN